MDEVLTDFLRHGKPNSQILFWGGWRDLHADLLQFSPARVLPAWSSRSSEIADAEQVGTASNEKDEDDVMCYRDRCLVVPTSLRKINDKQVQRRKSSGPPGQPTVGYFGLRRRSVSDS